MLKTVVRFLGAVLDAAELPGSRGRLDLFADRLVRAASEPTLSLAVEHLLGAAMVSVDRLCLVLVSDLLSVAASADGPRVLALWREQPKLLALLAATRDQDVLEQALAAVELPAAAGGGCVPARRPCPITLRVRCETPLSHGADTRAGNATLFRRQLVLTDAGTLHLPYYSGNAVRGQMRRLLADHFAASMGFDLARPVWSVWFFSALYMGGALEEKSAATAALRKQLGDNGALRGQGIRDLRQHLPALSLLGANLGNRSIPGHCQHADLRPVCREWGTGDRPVAELLAWEYLTRQGDTMIASTEVLRAGVMLEGGIDHDRAMPALELAALGRGLQLLAEHGRLGGEVRRGFGRVDIQAAGVPDPAPYDRHLADNRAAIFEYLQLIGAFG